MHGEMISLPALEPFLNCTECMRSVVFPNLASVFKCEEVPFNNDTIEICTGEIKGV